MRLVTLESFGAIDKIPCLRSFFINNIILLIFLFCKEWIRILALSFLFGIIKPYIDKNPIDFPFSDGILVATWEGTLIRVLILLVVSFVAGYLPAKIIIRKNTLDAILGR